MKTQGRLLVCLLIILTLVPLTVAAKSPSDFERPPILPAQALAPASLLSGDGFYVDHQVPTDGLSAHFTIRSDVGTFQANSVEMLRIRIAEIPAIEGFSAVGVLLGAGCNPKNARSVPAGWAV
jgi:hypothetical protein